MKWSQIGKNPNDVKNASAQQRNKSKQNMAKWAIVVEWNAKQRAFQAISDESMDVQFPTRSHASNQRSFVHDSDDETIDEKIQALIRSFEKCFEIHDISTAIADMHALRSRVLTKILDTQTPLKWLPIVLLKWQELLSEMDKTDERLAPAHLVEYCQELVALAGGWKLIGDIVQARSTLGKCFKVTKRHLKTPLKEGENLTLQQVAIAAKKLLLDCVAFQTALSRNVQVLERHKAPKHVQLSLSKELWLLFREAPLAVNIAQFLTQSLMKQRQFALVTRFLEHSPFVGAIAELTLTHARALAYVGYYRQSIQISQTYAAQVDEDAAMSTNVLRGYCNYLSKLLQARASADEWLRLDEYEKAAKGYEECIAQVDSADHKQMAALLFGHANALLGLEQLSLAIDNLRKSLQLDPTSKIASIRLQTACLQLETEWIKKELSGKPSNRRFRASSLIR